MKFKIFPSALYKGLDLSKRCKGKVSLDSAETLVVASVKEGCIFVANGNSDMDVQVRIKCDVVEDGSIIVPTAPLWRLLPKMLKELVTIERVAPPDESPRLLIEATSSNWVIYGSDEGKLSLASYCAITG
ncbi:MAG: hypothetical protein ACFCBU_10155 [Cyanophyceae cyanobacterium]